jgi:glycosyltransferase involved in cell wall biosynthesis
MTILWIPHCPFQPGSVRRDEHLIRHLKNHHRIISVTWEAGPDTLRNSITKGLRFNSTTLKDGRTSYHVRRVPDITRRFRQNQRDACWLNEWMFRKDIRRIIEQENVDILVTAYSSFMTGFPPFDIDVPIIFDYLDCAEWTSDAPHEKPYIKQSDLVLAVSALAEEQACRLNKNVEYLPNGADIERLNQASGEEIRRKYGLENAIVVSLIGLMDSSYLIEAVLKARSQIPDLKCLLVGESEYLRASVADVPDADDLFVFTGPVPYKDVAEYFAATDIGLYPVRGVSYDDGRSPLKVFEYTATGCPVVTPAIREVKRLDFSNLIYTEPTASAFAEGIVQAAHQYPSKDHSVEEYDWSKLAAKLDRLLPNKSSVIS